MTKGKDEENDYFAEAGFPCGTPPKDIFHIAYLSFFALGAGILLPWNVFIVAVDYFDYLYPNTHIDRVFSIAYMLPSFIFLLVLMEFGRTYNMRTRINCALVLYLITILVVPVMDEAVLKGERGTQVTQCVTIGAVVFTGIADALALGSLVGAAGELPERYMQALFGGTAASGVIVCLLRIITKSALPETASGLRISSNLYFAVSGAFMVICIVLNNLVGKLPVISYYSELKLRALDAAPLLKGKEKFENSFQKSNDSNQSAYFAKEVAVNHSLENLITPVTYLHVFKQIQGLAIALSSIYVVTLSIFPGFITEDVHSTLLGDWYPILLVAIYKFSDFIGMMFTAMFCIEEKSLIVGGCIARVLFFPLFAGCLHGPKFLRKEPPVIILTSLLGLSNGYYTSAIMINAPKVVPLQEAETAGIILVILLVAGLAAGSALGWVWVI